MIYLAMEERVRPMFTLMRNVGQRSRQQNLQNNLKPTNEVLPQILL
jgi:hypothetical protein